MKISRNFFPVVLFCKSKIQTLKSKLLKIKLGEKTFGGLQKKHAFTLYFGLAFFIILVVYGLFSRELQTVFSATYTWVQNDWSGGADVVNYASHPGNQTGWKKYSSKDAGIAASATGVRLVSSSYVYNASSTFASNLATNTFFATGTIRLLKLVNAPCTAGNECQSGQCVNSLCYVPPPPCSSTSTCGQACVYAGVTYNSVLIGGQCWFRQNLNVGTTIPKSQAPSNNSLIEKWCYLDNEANCTTYGGWYNWSEAVQLSQTCQTNYCAAAQMQGICPSGWHIPSDTEIKTLEMYLGMTQTQADLQNTWRGTDQGVQISVGGTSGLDIPYGGWYSSSWVAIGSTGYITTISENGASTVWTRYITASVGSYPGIYRLYNNKSYAFPVRCLR